MSRHHIVSSVRGPGGGFYLSKENRTVPLMDIIHIIVGDNRLSFCMLSLQECNAEYPCPMHNIIGDTQMSFVKNLVETTVNDLMLDIETGRSFFPF